VPVVTISSKGQIIIPSELRKKFKIKQGDRFELQEHEGKIVLVPLQDKPFIKLHGALKGKTSLTESLQKEHVLEIKKEER